MASTNELSGSARVDGPNLSSDDVHLRLSVSPRGCAGGQDLVELLDGTPGVADDAESLVVVATDFGLVDVYLDHLLTVE